MTGKWVQKFLLLLVLIFVSNNLTNCLPIDITADSDTTENGDVLLESTLTPTLKSTVLETQDNEVDLKREKKTDQLGPNLKEEKEETIKIMRHLENLYKTQENRVKMAMVKMNEQIGKIQEMQKEEDQDFVRQEWEKILMEDQERRQRTDFWEHRIREETKKLFLEQLAEMQEEEEERRKMYGKLMMNLVDHHIKSI